MCQSGDFTNKRVVLAKYHQQDRDQKYIRKAFQIANVLHYCDMF